MTIKKFDKNIVSIIDNGIGNYFSVKSACEYLGFPAVVTNDKDIISRSSKIILPGVGKFEQGIKSLHDLKLIDFLNDQVLDKKKFFLGICLGCQLLLDYSEESEGIMGLSWIKGYAKKFPDTKEYPSPHVGWNDLNFVNQDFFKEKIIMYFNHSYYPVINDKNLIVAKSKYPNEFTSIFAWKNIFGAQPHPEKSQNHGLEFLKIFLNVK